MIDRRARIRRMACAYSMHRRHGHECASVMVPPVLPVALFSWSMLPASLLLLSVCTGTDGVVASSESSSATTGIRSHAGAVGGNAANTESNSQGAALLPNFVMVSTSQPATFAFPRNRARRDTLVRVCIATQSWLGTVDGLPVARASCLMAYNYMHRVA